MSRFSVVLVDDHAVFTGALASVLGVAVVLHAVRPRANTEQSAPTTAPGCEGCRGERPVRMAAILPP